MELADIIITFLNKIGLAGLFLAMFLEGSSLPFPGIIVVLSYGYAIDLSIIEAAFISIIMSIIYSIASFIPFMLASRCEGIIRKKFGRKLGKAQAWFIRYGMWSISLSRPFSLGNYISYVAGMSEVPKGRYFIYTFIGILPWSFVILVIGNEFRSIFSGW